MSYVPPHLRGEHVRPALSLEDRLGLPTPGCTSHACMHGLPIPGCGDAWTKKLRIACWKALKGDDARSLLAVISDGATALEISEGELMQRLELWLWRHDGMEHKPTGLIAVAAGNNAGVPAVGALGCLGALLHRFSHDSTACSPAQYSLAVSRAHCRRRGHALQILRQYGLKDTDEEDEDKYTLHAFQ
jgi:hypothetical protein